MNIINKHMRTTSDEECRRENAWDECTKISTNPVYMYKNVYKYDKLPLGAIMDGYDDNDDGRYVTSYGDFEEDILCNDDAERLKRQCATGRAFVKNNVFVDTANQKGINTIHRVELNWDDGYVQNTIVAGTGTTKDDLGNAGDDWMDPPSVQKGDSGNPNAPKLFVPRMYSLNTSDICYPKGKIGCSDYFFTERTPFVEAFKDDIYSNSSAMAIDKCVKPEMIGFKPKLNGIYAFNDIVSYCNSTGAFFADITAMVQALTYISHNILNLLIPKQIVLVVDTYRGVDIPVKDYIPNVDRPRENIPDYDNKMSAVVNLLKDIRNGSIFLSRVGGFYLKMTINPAMTIINFVLYNSQNFRLVLNLPTIDNQILYDCEERHGVYPMKYISGQNPYWHVSRNHDDAEDVLKTMQSNYYEKLNGVEGGELEAYMRTYGIDELQSIFPSSVPVNELTVNSPKDLSEFLW